MPFLTPDVQVTIEPSGLYRLTAPLVYAGNADTFTVPAGFRSDLASVPRCLTWLVPIAGVHDRAAVLHDWLCRELERRRTFGSRYQVPANAVDTDGIFRRVLRELGVGAVRRWLMWTGVRLGALGTPSRRAGWLRTAPAVVGVSLLALPFVLLPALLCLAVIGVDNAVEKIR